MATFLTSSAIVRARSRFARRLTRPAPPAPSLERWLSPCSLTDTRLVARSRPLRYDTYQSGSSLLSTFGGRRRPCTGRSVPRCRGDLARSAQNPCRNSTDRWMKPHGTVTAEQPGHRRPLGSHRGGRPRAQRFARSACRRVRYRGPRPARMVPHGSRGQGRRASLFAAQALARSLIADGRKHQVQEIREFISAIVPDTGREPHPIDRSGRPKPK